MGEGGLSLVEVLASIVILTLLLTTFLMMFLQSAKVNKASEHIIDATYIAQTEMERFYQASRNFSGNLSDANKIATIKDYTTPSIKGDWIIFKRDTDREYGYIKVRLEGNNKKKATRIIVEVYENKDPDGYFVPKWKMW